MIHIDLEDLPEQEPVAGFRARFVHSESMTLAYWSVDAGAELPRHAHPQEQVASVLEGRFELEVDGRTAVLGPGQVVVIPSGVPHGGRALTACRMVDVWHPTREEYR